MKTAKILLSILLVAALLAGCVPAVQDPSTTQNLQQPNTSATQTQPTTSTVTQPATTQPATSQPPVTAPPVTAPPPTEPDNIRDLDFTVYDAEGNEVKLTDFIGTPIILNFWASWCVPCLAEMSHFNDKYKAYGDQIQFMMVNGTSFDTREDADAVINKYRYVFPVFYDTDGIAAEVYQVSSIPVTYAIDAEGNIIQKYVGSMTKKELQKLIDKLLATQ